MLTLTAIAVLALITPAPVLLIPVAAQQETAPAADGFFSGNVVEMAPDHVIVSRTTLGKPPVKRTFALTADTKVEGKMKNKSRVTVRYQSGEDGDVAVSILVREGKNGK